LRGGCCELGGLFALKGVARRWQWLFLIVVTSGSGRTNSPEADRTFVLSYPSN